MLQPHDADPEPRDTDALPSGIEDRLLELIDGPADLVLAGLEELVRRFPAFEAQIRGYPLGRAPLPDVDSDHGKMLGPYRLLERLPGGSMGIVYLARDTDLDRLVCIKTIPGARIAPELAERVRREARTIARLAHPNIVPVLAIEVDAGIPHVVMEFVPGVDLSRLLAAMRTDDLVDGDSARRLWRELAREEPAAAWPTPYVSWAVRVARDLAHALAHAHAEGVVHRDVKPSNVMIRADSSAQLLDFGVARVRGEDGGTRSGEFCGTIAYSAPEQVRNARRADARSDVWSLGALLFEALTLRRPFPGDGDSTRTAILEDRPPRLRSLRPDLPADLEVLVAKCLEYDPADRYPDAAALAADLEAFLDYRPIAARPLSGMARLVRTVRRRPARSAGVGAAALVMLFAALGWTLWHGEVMAKDRAREERDKERWLGELRAAEADLAARRFTDGLGRLARLAPGPDEASATRAALAVAVGTRGLRDWRGLAVQLEELRARNLDTGQRAKHELLSVELVTARGGDPRSVALDEQLASSRSGAANEYLRCLRSTDLREARASAQLAVKEEICRHDGYLLLAQLALLDGEFEEVHEACGFLLHQAPDDPVIVVLAVIVAKLCGDPSRLTRAESAAVPGLPTKLRSGVDKVLAWFRAYNRFWVRLLSTLAKASEVETDPTRDDDALNLAALEFLVQFPGFEAKLASLQRTWSTTEEPERGRMLLHPLVIAELRRICSVPWREFVRGKDGRSALAKMKELRVDPPNAFFALLTATAHIKVYNANSGSSIGEIAAAATELRAALATPSWASKSALVSRTCSLLLATADTLLVTRANPGTRARRAYERRLRKTLELAAPIPGLESIEYRCLATYAREALGDHDLALRILDRGQDAHPEDATLWVMRARILESDHAEVLARRAWESVLRIDPHHDAARKALGGAPR